MENYSFRRHLKERQEKIDSLLCVGLDPILEKLPLCLNESKARNWWKIASWMVAIVEATAPFASMYKLQRAHYESVDGGIKAMRMIIYHIKENHPDIPVFLDCKRGDIGRTQERYQVAHFDLDGVHGVNFSPYMGMDCMEFLVNRKLLGRSIVGLCYTSNEAAREVQDVKLENGEWYWEFMAKKILSWSERLGIMADTGLVMAAAHEKPKGSGEIFSYHLERVRELVGLKLWFLIPGIGTQGGFVYETVQKAFCGYGTIAINSSSGIIFASQEDDYEEASAGKAEELCDQIRKAV